MARESYPSWLVPYCSTHLPFVQAAKSTTLGWLRGAYGPVVTADVADSDVTSV